MSTRKRENIIILISLSYVILFIILIYLPYYFKISDKEEDALILTGGQTLTKIIDITNESIKPGNINRKDIMFKSEKDNEYIFEIRVNSGNYSDVSNYLKVSIYANDSLISTSTLASLLNKFNPITYTKHLDEDEYLQITVLYEVDKRLSSFVDVEKIDFDVLIDVEEYN